MLEAKLRSPVEWVSAFACVTGSILLYCKDNWFGPLTAYQPFLIGGLLALGLKRGIEGWQVMLYRRRLRSLRLYRLASRRVPHASGKLFLGRGFRWQPIHTQRLYEAREKCALWQGNGFLQKKAALLLGGNSALHNVESCESNVFMPLSDRVGHTLVLGTTRVGKTRLLELLVSQDIHRGDVVIVFDPKGDSDLLRRIVFEARQCSRQNDVLIFHLGFPAVSARYNPIGHFARVTEVANRIANQLPSSGESAAFKEFGWRFVNIITKALVALGKRPNYRLIKQYILKIDDLLLDYAKQWLPHVDMNWETQVKAIENTIEVDHLPHHLRSRSLYLLALVRYLQKYQGKHDIVDGLCSAFYYDKSYFDKITASLLPLLEKLTTGQTADLICPDYVELHDDRPIFDWMQVIRGKKIVYVGLDALSDHTVASAVGNSMLADLASVAGQLYKYGVQENLNDKKSFIKTLHPICVHCDEFNELIGDEFIPLLNKAGGAGIQVTAYTQTWSDVEAKLGQRAKAGQVAGNLNTIIGLRVLDEDTARFITQKLPQNIPIESLIPVSSVSDNHNQSAFDFNAHYEDRIQIQTVPLLIPSDLMQLPKGQAFCVLNGGSVWKIRIPLPKDNLNALPESVEQIILMQRS
jgi:conjugative coupling factor TraD (TOL family)